MKLTREEVRQLECDAGAYESLCTCKLGAKCWPHQVRAACQQLLALMPEGEMLELPAEFDWQPPFKVQEIIYKGRPMADFLGLLMTREKANVMNAEKALEKIVDQLFHAAEWHQNAAQMQHPSSSGKMEAVLHAIKAEVYADIARIIQDTLTGA